MTKPFNIHDWQAKQRLAENDEYQKRQDRLTPGKNPDEFYGKDSVFTKLKDDPNFVRKLNDKNTKKEHHGDDFPKGLLDKKVSSFLDDLKKKSETDYDAIEDIMKKHFSIDETNSLGSAGAGAKFNAGPGMAHTDLRYPKKNKED